MNSFRGQPVEPVDQHAAAALYQAALARAIKARKAPLNPKIPHGLPPDFIADELGRLTCSERGAILAYFASDQLDWQRFYERDYLHDAFQALIDQFDTIAPETAGQILSIYAKRRIIRSLDGLDGVLATMERVGPAAYRGCAPLQRAYAQLRLKYPDLRDDRAAREPMVARFDRLLGLAAGPVAVPAADGSAAPDGPVAGVVADRSSAADDALVDAYVAACSARIAELSAWITDISAVQPDFHDVAVQSWLSDYRSRGGDPNREVVPINCYAVLNPPPPRWFLDAHKLFEPRGSDDRKSIGFASDLRSWLQQVQLAGFEVLDPAWHEAGRRAARETAKTRHVYDWSQPKIVNRAMLRIETSDGPIDLLDLLWQARSAVPTAKWEKSAKRLLASPAEAAALDAVRRWLEHIPVSGIPAPEVAFRGNFYDTFRRSVLLRISLFGGAREAAIASLCMSGSPAWSGAFPCAPNTYPALFSEENDVILRGAIWLLSIDPASVDILRRTALALLVKVPFQHRSLKGLNSCIWALGRIATGAAVVALGQIRLKVRDARLSKQITKALVDAARQAGLTIEDLEEIAVPSYGLDEQAESVIELAGGTARLAIESTTDVIVTIYRPDGRPAKSVPAAVKADGEAKAALAALRAGAAEIAQALPVQRLRLERSWLTARRWRGAVFRERFLAHPLMNWFAARLVWTVTSADGATRSVVFRGCEPMDSEDRSAPPLADDDDVALWHPVTAEPETVRGWRAFMLRHRIVQPIKQAYREIYGLTAAERQAQTYSNRFAGHILRQHQSAALARLRGWSCRLRVWADVPNDEPTHIKLPAHGLAAEYWTEGTGGEEPEVTDGQAYVFLKTDQIRFRRLTDNGDWRRDGGQHLVLGPYVDFTEIGDVVFSEVMRDIDLFVGVASIGHDPTWLDAGADASHPNQWRHDVATEYWNAFNTAGLAESAKARQAFLAELLPKLAIAGSLSLDDRFLIVRGKLRTYRIHIGSGNILMEPDNRYLCIVQNDRARPARDAVFLPFEGDGLLSLIISKAFLLAQDDAITDPMILSQFR
jgi:hypothetical protein